VGELLNRENRPATGNRTSVRWQFKLWHAFVVMTHVAVAAAVSRAFGSGTLVISTGLLVALLNWMGAFDLFQTGRPQSIILGLAWLMFLVSLALPAMEVFGPILGASAAWAAVILPWRVITDSGPNGWGLVAFLALDIANLLMALLPFEIWRLARGDGRAYSVVLCLAMVAAGLWV
jgi:hypothetical protein